MELTSLGRTYLATLPASDRHALAMTFKQRRPRAWPALSAEIAAALSSIAAVGNCAASWQPEVVAVAAPPLSTDMAYAVNVSALTAEPVVNRLPPKLLTLRDPIHIALDRSSGGPCP